MKSFFVPRSYPFDLRRWYHCGLHDQVKGTSLDEIRIVREFSDVF
jgi:hypothetical protein